MPFNASKLGELASGGSEGASIGIHYTPREPLRCNIILDSIFFVLAIEKHRLRLKSKEKSVLICAICGRDGSVDPKTSFSPDSSIICRKVASDDHFLLRKGWRRFWRELLFSREAAFTQGDA